MMAHLEPSVELTGGPWYTDNELDTEFIKLLCTACLRFIQDRVSSSHALARFLNSQRLSELAEAEALGRHASFFKTLISHL